jgi:hypothetical protein
MVVTSVMDAVARQKVQDPSTIAGKQLAALAAFIFDVHPQQVKKGHPLWIYIPLVSFSTDCLRENHPIRRHD